MYLAYVRVFIFRYEPPTGIHVGIGIYKIYKYSIFIEVGSSWVIMPCSPLDG
jgi:hypothetical protein